MKTNYSTPVAKMVRFDYDRVMAESRTCTQDTIYGVNDEPYACDTFYPDRQVHAMARSGCGNVSGSNWDR